MASTYTLNQGIEKPGTGEQSGTWGNTTNTNFDIIDRALSGVGAISLTGTTTTLTTTDGSLTDGMYKVLVLGGSPSGTNTITIGDNTQDKVYFVVNNSGQEVIFTQGTGANVTIANGAADIIYADGAGSGAAVASFFGTALKVGTDLTIGGDSTFNGDTNTFTSANANDPVVIIKNTTNDTAAARLHFVKDKGAAGADGDDIGTIEFISDDSGQAQTSFAKIVAEVSESANTDEAGKLSFFVAESDGTTTALTAGLILEGEHATDGEVDVTIGAGAGSTTSIAGDLSLAHDGAVISFGADSEVTLTHVHDTGLQLNDRLEITTSDNVEQLRLTSTDADANEGPLAIFHRNSSSPADGDSLGRIYFSGENDADEEIQYVRFQSILDDASDGSEDSSFRIQSYVGGAVKSKFFTTSAETVFNDDGADLDFRVEVNGHTHMLYVDNSAAAVCIGANSSSSIADYAISGANDLVIGNANNEQNGITIVSGSGTGNSTINFSDSNSGDGRQAGHFNYQHQYDEFQWYVNSLTRLIRFSSVGNLVVGTGWLKQTNDGTGGGQFYNGTNITGYNGASFNEFNSKVANETILALKAWNSGTDQEGLVVAHAANTDNTSSTYISCVNDVNGSKFKVEGNGNVESATNSYGSTSDERLKTIIGDASSQWDDIKGLKFKKYKRYYSDEVHLGLISQEAEKVSPNIIYDSKPSITDIVHDSTFGTLYTKEDEDNGNVPKGRKVGDIKEIKEQVKSIKYSVIYMKAVKALQEAMTRIETLEAKVKALEEA